MKNYYYKGYGTNEIVDGEDAIEYAKEHCAEMKEWEEEKNYIESDEELEDWFFSGMWVQYFYEEDDYND